jgi:hypothetical protein
MDRREALAALAAVFASGGSLASAASEAITVIYLGAKDCSNCRAFDLHHKADFEKRVAAKGMIFREFKVDSVRDIGQASAWPPDLRWLLDMLPGEGGTPWFFVVQGHRLIKQTQSFASIA